MSGFRSFLNCGHSPTLFAAFLYFAFSCCIWVLNGAMAPFTSETFNLTPAQKGLIMVAMLFGFFFVKTFKDLLAMGVLLGIAGASFGVALSLGSGSFPAKHKGLAMGLVGAGNVGTAVSVLVAPPLAQAFGWVAVYGMAAIAISIPIVVMVVLTQEPDDLDKHASFKEHIACLFEKDGWAYSLITPSPLAASLAYVPFCPPTTTTSLA